MEAVAEQLVRLYLTRGGTVFIVPQYPVPSETPDKDWSCPDFVALDFERSGRPEVIVVEVATGSNLNGLFQKFSDRETIWFKRLRARLVEAEIITERWPIRFLGFVREDKLENARTKFLGIPDVAVASIESAAFSWRYWKDRTGGGLPR